MERVANKTIVLSLVLLCFCLVPSSAQETTPQILIESRQTTIAEVLEQINIQSGYELSFLEGVFDNQKKLALNRDIYHLPDLLNKIFDDEPIEWEIEGKLIIIRKPTKKISRKVTISGFVKDQATGEDLVGAHIINQSTGQGLFANTYGFFSLELDNYPQRITVTYVGYEPIELELQTQQDTLVNVYLSANSSELQEVIVSGEISTYVIVQLGAITLQ